MMATRFCARLAENLRFGHALLIAGKTSEGAERLNIALCENSSSQDQNHCHNGIVMHFNFESDELTLHQFHNNELSHKLSLTCDYFHFLNQFAIYIVIGHEKIHMSINDDFNVSYKFELDIKVLNVLEIKGDVDYICQMDHRQYFPYLWPPHQVPERRLHFSNDCPIPFETGHVMVISAQLKGNDEGRFIVHLRNAWDPERQELHMSVRFDTQTVVWNSKTLAEGEAHEQHYDFDEEERSRYFPFSDFFQPFKLAIGFAKYGFNIAKDGLFLYTFIYRTEDVLPCIGGLKIFGIDGTKVEVRGVDHLHIDDAFCIGFERFSKL